MMEGATGVITTMDGSACPKEFGIEGKRDDGGGQGQRVEMSLLPLKKRALNDSSSSGVSFSCSPKWRRVDDCARATPVPHHLHELAAAAVAGAAPPEPVAKVDALSDAEKSRLSKGKCVAAPETSSVAPQPHVKNKLMHDGIRSGARLNDEEAVFAATAAAENKKNNDETDAAGAVFCEAVERQLEKLGATRPWFVLRKRLEKSDACPNQNRLLVSCKRDSLAGCPLTGCFSASEMRRVEDKGAGLLVTALDGRGARYFPVTCKFLDSNGGYRFISRWRAFLERNGLALTGAGAKQGGGGRWTRDVDLELWAFRSRELPKQPRLDGAGKPVGGEEEAEHLHPDGSLGLILLHHEHRTKQRGGEHEEQKGKRARQPGGEEDAKQQRVKRASPVPRGEAIAGVGATTASEAEMVAAFGQPTSLAVIGMLRLRGAMLEDTREHTDAAPAPHLGDGNAAQ